MSEIVSTPRKQLTSEPSQSSIWVAIGKLLLVALFALILFNGITRIIVFTPVKGISMMPTYEPNQILVMYSYKSPESYERGDIIVVEATYPDSTGTPQTLHIVKRVIGVPGDTLYYDSETNKLLVNGEVFDEPYLAADCMSDGYDWGLGEYSVPEDCVFIMGDNRNHSTDSRILGAIPYKDIRGYIL